MNMMCICIPVERLKPLFLSYPLNDVCVYSKYLCCMVRKVDCIVPYVHVKREYRSAEILSVLHMGHSYRIIAKRIDPAGGRVPDQYAIHSEFSPHLKDP